MVGRFNFLVVPWMVSLTYRNELAYVNSVLLVSGGCGY